MQNKFNRWTLGLIAGLTLAAGACATAPTPAKIATAAYNAEQLAADTATAATSTFNTYYAQQTAAAPATPGLESAKNEIDSADKTLASTLKVVDALRINYTANAATTNLTSLQIGLDTIANQSTNVVTLVKTLITKPAAQ